MPEQSTKFMLYRHSTFGKPTDEKFSRKAQTDGTMKYSVTWEEVKYMQLYDVALNATLSNLPPSNVILSSNLAYWEIRLGTTTDCIPLRQLHTWWPANMSLRKIFSSVHLKLVLHHFSQILGASPQIG